MTDVLALDAQLCFALYSAMHAVGRTYAPLLDRLGLTYPQYLVMLVLWERDDLSVKAIGARLDLDSGTLTPLLKRLEAADLVTRQRATTDERRVQIRLTGKGIALRASAAPVPSLMACAMALTPGQMNALRGQLIDLRSTLVEGAARSDMTQNSKPAPREVLADPVS